MWRHGHPMWLYCTNFLMRGCLEKNHTSICFPLLPFHCSRFDKYGSYLVNASQINYHAWVLSSKMTNLRFISFNWFYFVFTPFLRWTVFVHCVQIAGYMQQIGSVWFSWIWLSHDPNRSEIKMGTDEIYVLGHDMERGQGQARRYEWAFLYALVFRSLY